MEIYPVRSHHVTETVRRSLVKTISYRMIIVALDFLVVYLFTRQLKAAVGFTIVSNIYTAVIYFIHERIWDKIKWGKIIFIKKSS